MVDAEWNAEIIWGSRTKAAGQCHRDQTLNYFFLNNITNSPQSTGDTDVCVFAFLHSFSLFVCHVLFHLKTEEVRLSTFLHRPIITPYSRKLKPANIYCRNIVTHTHTHFRDSNIAVAHCCVTLLKDKESGLAVVLQTVRLRKYAQRHKVHTYKWPRLQRWGCHSADQI